MNKGALREDIETIVKVLPRPKMISRHISKRRNSWLILQEYGDADGIVLLNSVTNHEGSVPYDSVREFRQPDMLILRAQVHLGKGGEFTLEPISEGLDFGMEVELEEFLPERLAFIKGELKELSENETKLLTEFAIRGKMTAGEIQQICRVSLKVTEPNRFLSLMMYKTSLIEKVDEQRLSFNARIRPEYSSILEHLLLNSRRNGRTVVSQSDSPVADESGNS
ncbi:MAG: hypothetical protein OJF50_000012 [Nitrospira sp.]|jgi:hypothetical protein|nr:hypothetical protein [Nitrospira sp.]